MSVSQSRSGVNCTYITYHNGCFLCKFMIKDGVLRMPSMSLRWNYGLSMFSVVQHDIKRPPFTTILEASTGSLGTDLGTWDGASGIQTGLTLTYFTARSALVT